MVGGVPVEASAVDEKDFFFPQEVEHQLGVVLNVVHLQINLGEGVQRAHRFHATNPRNFIELFPRDVALPQQTAAFAGEVENGLPTAQGHLNSVLSRHIGAEARGRQQFKALNKALRMMLRAGEHHPSGAVTRHAVGFGQPVEGDTQQIRCQGGDGNVLRIIIKNTVVDFVCENEQLVLAGLITTMALVLSVTFALMSSIEGFQSSSSSHR